MRGDSESGESAEIVTGKALTPDSEGSKSPRAATAQFFLEAIIMTPLALFCFLLPRDVHSKSKDGLLLDTLELDGEDGDGGDDHDHEAYRGVSEDGSDMYDASERSSRLTTSTAEAPSIVDEVMQCLRRPLFVSNALGYVRRAPRARAPR